MDASIIAFHSLPVFSEWPERKVSTGRREKRREAGLEETSREAEGLQEIACNR
jgi:hypothetical protein